jgi:hypothetical protein
MREDTVMGIVALLVFGGPLLLMGCCIFFKGVSEIIRAWRQRT